MRETFRQANDGLIHWCPGCEQAHRIPRERWAISVLEGRVSATPSVVQHLGNGRVCHYFLTDGRINFCPDSAHALAGLQFEMPELPAFLRTMH